MKITLMTFLLTLIVLGACIMGQAQIEKNGWKLVFVTYKDDTTFTEKSDKEYGEPSVAFFVKDYPYQVGKEYPKLLVMDLSEDIGCDDKQPGLRKTLYEFDCSRNLNRRIRLYWAGGREEDKKGLIDLTTWSEVLPDSPIEAIYRYACRPRTPSKK